MKRVILLAAFGVAALPLGAQRLDLRSLDRYAKSASETVDLSLNSNLLKVASKFLSGDDPDEVKVKKLIAGIRGVYIKSFEFENEGAFSMADLDAIRAQMKEPEWSRVVGVTDHKSNEKSEVFMQVDAKGQARGLAIIATEPKQLTVVQIDGVIALEDIASLESVGMPSLNLSRPSKSERPSKEEKREQKDE